MARVLQHPTDFVKSSSIPRQYFCTGAGAGRLGRSVLALLDTIIGVYAGRMEERAHIISKEVGAPLWLAQAAAIAAAAAKNVVLGDPREATSNIGPVVSVPSSWGALGFARSLHLRQQWRERVRPGG